MVYLLLYQLRLVKEFEMVSKVERLINFRTLAEKAGLVLGGPLQESTMLLVQRSEIPYFSLHLKYGQIDVLNATAGRVHRLLLTAQQHSTGDEFHELCSLKANADTADRGHLVWRSDRPAHGRITLVQWLRQQGEDLSDLFPVAR